MAVRQRAKAEAHSHFQLVEGRVTSQQAPSRAPKQKNKTTVAMVQTAVVEAQDSNI